MKNSSNTPLIRSSVFAEKKLRNIFIKDESKNTYGTIKDRRNVLIINEANRLRVDKLVLITSGNNGYSLAKLAESTSIKVVCIVNRSLNKKILSLLRSVAYQVIELNLDEKILRPEEIISFARERDDEVIWDVTNGYEEAYAAVVSEIFSELETVDYIVVPLGSGGIFIGFVQALDRFRKKTKVIGIGAQSSFRSIADKLSTPWTPYAKAIENYEKNGHRVFRLDEKEIKSVFQKYQNVVPTEPSSAVVFAAPERIDFKQNETIVLVNSGRLTTE